MRASTVLDTRDKRRHSEKLDSALPSRIFNHSAGELAERFNRLPFPISHNLDDHPLFSLPRLVELAKTLWALGDGRVVLQEGNAGIEDRWDEMRGKTLSFIKGIQEIEQSGSWVVLHSVQEDPEYRSCIEQCLAELSELTGTDLDREITWFDGYIFIASPGAVTPHHIDHETNFLLQVHGSKDFNVCDPQDRSLLFEEEIENYYAGDLSAARLKSVSQEKAFVFPMVPGSGVHIPSKGPHWVRNSGSYSVSFSINFCMRQTDRVARVYQWNHYLRKFKLMPTPPNRSFVRDWLKVMTLARPGKGNAANKNALLRQNMKRLEVVSRAVERVLGPSQVVGR